VPQTGREQLEMRAMALQYDLHTGAECRKHANIPEVAAQGGPGGPYTQHWTWGSENWTLSSCFARAAFDLRQDHRNSWSLSFFVCLKRDLLG
jgi:hypothetical protein